MAKFHLSSFWYKAHQKCFTCKPTKKPQKNATLHFSKTLQTAHETHRKICKEWRRAGRPESNEHPTKFAKKESQRRLQRIVRDEEANKAKAQHEDLMKTNASNIELTCRKLKKICGDNIKET